MKNIFILICTAFLVLGYAKESVPIDNNNSLINSSSSNTVEKKYISNVAKILKDNLKYSEDARIKKIEGKVDVSFEIHTNGKVENIKILKCDDIYLKDYTEKFLKSLENKFPVPKKNMDFQTTIIYELNNYSNEYALEVKEIIKKNLKYSQTAQRRKIEGKVLAYFELQTDGKIENILVLKYDKAYLKEYTEKFLKSLEGKLPLPEKKMEFKLPIVYKLYPDSMQTLHKIKRPIL